MKGKRVAKLKTALECDNQVEVVWDEVGFMSICPQAAGGDGTHESTSNGDQGAHAASTWVEAVDYPWDWEDELGFFGPLPEWGVG